MTSVNPPPLVPRPELGVPGILAMWALATVIEAPIWALLFAKRFKSVRWPFVFGWMALVQAVSTPLSLVLAVLIYAPFGSVGPPWPFFSGPGQALLAATNFMINPVGVLLAFLLCPMFLEAFLWRASWCVRAHQPTGGKPENETSLRLHHLLAAATIANTFSFAAGLVFLNPFLVTWNDVWLVVWVLAISLAFAAAWSIAFDYRQRKAASNVSLEEY